MSSQPPLRDVEPEPEGSRPGDATAPVDGGQFRSADIDAMALFEQLTPKAQERFAQQWLASQPASVAKQARARRERIRLILTVVVIAGILGEASAGFYVAAIAKSASWDHVKDWMTIALAPLVGFATVTAAFWFPSRESE